MGGSTRVVSRLLAVAAVVAVVLGWGAAAGAQGEEAIHRYTVDIAIKDDGSLLVSEAIEYDFGTTARHGIFRDIPDRLTYDDRYDRVFPIHVVSVEGSAGTPTHYEIEHSGGLFRIKIGDPDRTITGVHVYVITYRVEGAMNGFADHDELYWNALGSSWPVPVDSVSVRVRAPAAVQRVACFAGPFGSNLPCSVASARDSTATFSHSNLGPYQSVTVVVGLPKGAVPAPHPILQERWSLQRAFSVTPLTAGLAGGIALLVAVGLGSLFWRNGRDRRAIGTPVDIAYATSLGGEQQVPLFERGPTPVEYAPPDEIRPGQVGTLVDEAANPLDVTATIVDLAVRGYLRIEEIPKRGLFGKPDWRLMRLKDTDGLLPYEGLLLDGLFRDADGEEEGQAGTPDGPTVKLSGLRRHFSARLQSVQDSLYEDAVGHGWFSGRPDRVRHTWTKRGWIVAAVGGSLVVLAAAKTHLALIALPLALGGLALVFGARWMPRRTPKGTGMVRRVLGFRTYIETAEVEESRFAERKNLFSQYLPFAVVFGCTERWARAFAHLGDQPPETSWYVGPHPFTVASFTSSIDHFSVATAGTITSTPAGSGSSGFGGGGFSGGGGGGGGGGSW